MPTKYYLYGNRVILPENAEVFESFPIKTQNRLCLVNGFENATKSDAINMPPRYSLYDPQTGIRLYEIAEDLAGNKVLYVVDECNARKQLVNTNPLSLRLYNCLIDDSGKYWRLERRDLKPSSLTATTKRRRVLVQNSGNATLLVEKPSCPSSTTTEYHRRRGHHLNKTKFICDKRPEVLRFH